ncbi:MAG: glycine cleavage system protein GcvH [Leptospiraceae bacterium]|nr:glycine cleavage system protein GcvH [Leptospiraceae bacterium]MCP5512911.1 glycine cleavage system protein GcvH [Leptospiraceae bacterium]
MNVLDGLEYTEKHEWLKLESDLATIGISDFAQNSLGDLVFVQLPKVGSKIEKGESCGTLESVKAAEDLYSPISGEVVEINESVVSDPSLLNKDAYGSWLIKLKNVDLSGREGLMDSQKYRDYISELS